jgi:hypothetical protein
MGKYNYLTTLKKPKAGTYHICYHSGKQISRGETYYREHIEDKFIHSLNPKKYCSICYEKHNEGLLSIPKK